MTNLPIVEIEAYGPRKGLLRMTKYVTRNGIDCIIRFFPTAKLPSSEKEGVIIVEILDDAWICDDMFFLFEEDIDLEAEKRYRLVADTDPKLDDLFTIKSLSFMHGIGLGEDVQDLKDRWRAMNLLVQFDESL